jgi:hypothetical protein
MGYSRRTGQLTIHQGRGTVSGGNSFIKKSFGSRHTIDNAARMSNLGGTLEQSQVVESGRF